MRNEVVLKHFGMVFVKSIVSMATHIEFENGGCLQNYQIKDLLSPCSYPNYLMCIFINIYENIKNILSLLHVLI